MTLDEQISAFKEKQAKIMDLHRQYDAALTDVKTDCETRIKAIETEFETKKAELAVELDRSKAEYCASMKEAFGVADGENANILDVVQLVRRVAVQA
jgi:hypothetical protein